MLLTVVNAFASEEGTHDLGGLHVQEALWQQRGFLGLREGVSGMERGLSSRLRKRFQQSASWYPKCSQFPIKKGHFWCISADRIERRSRATERAQAGLKVSPHSPGL